MRCLLETGLQTSSDKGLDFSDIPDGNWRLGGYELLEEIGRGGMGIIYRARQPHSNRIVALKRVSPQMGTSPEVVSRMLREVRVVASLEHPNILPIYEVGTGVDGLPFFSMKLAGGGSLQQARQKLGGESRKVVELMLKVARAVQYAHGQRILHRDLKPGNILLDGNGEPLVADFGLAKWMASDMDLSQTLSGFGTPGYVAPEQAAGPSHELTAAADIYSLGAVLFELFTGRPPFVGDNAWAVVREAAENPAPKLRTLMPRLDRDLETICAHCLEREPGARYGTAGDLADDLQCWLDGRPIHARPVSPVEQGWRWMRRNPVLVAVGVACLSLTIWGFYRQMENTEMAAQIQEADKQANAVGLWPVLDLDEASSETPAALAASEQLQKEVGAARGKVWMAATGVLPPKDYAAQARIQGVRYLLVGTTRLGLDGLRHYSLHAYDARSGSFVYRKTASSPQNDFGGLIQMARDFVGGERSVPPVSTEDLDQNVSPQVRDLLAAGEEYYKRYTVESLGQAIECARKAVALDVTSVHANALLAMSLSLRRKISGSSQPDSEKEAALSATRAVELAPDSALANRVQASVHLDAGQLEKAMDSSKRSTELDLDLGRGGVRSTAFLREAGRPDMALSWSQLAINYLDRPIELKNVQADILTDLGLDLKAAAIYRNNVDLLPDKPDGLLGLCRQKLLQGDFAGALLLANELEKKHPDQYFTRLASAQVRFFKGDYAEAANRYQALLASTQDDGVFFYGSVSIRSALGFCWLKTGREKEGRAMVMEAMEYSRGKVREGAVYKIEYLYDLAAIQAALQEEKEATETLGIASQAGWLEYRAVLVDPRFEAVRDKPGFKNFLESTTEKVNQLQKSALQKINIPLEKTLK